MPSGSLTSPDCITLAYVSSNSSTCPSVPLGTTSLGNLGKTFLNINALAAARFSGCDSLAISFPSLSTATTCQSLLVLGSLDGLPFRLTILSFLPLLSTALITSSGDLVSVVSSVNCSSSAFVSGHLSMAARTRFSVITFLSGLTELAGTPSSIASAIVSSDAVTSSVSLASFHPRVSAAGLAAPASRVLIRSFNWSRRSRSALISLSGRSPQNSGSFSCSSTALSSAWAASRLSSAAVVVAVSAAVVVAVSAAVVVAVSAAGVAVVSGAGAPPSKSSVSPTAGADIVSAISTRVVSLASI